MGQNKADKERIALRRSNRSATRVPAILNLFGKRVRTWITRKNGQNVSFGSRNNRLRRLLYPVAVSFGLLRGGTHTSPSGRHCPLV